MVLAYNTSAQASTGYTPFFLMFGRVARLPVDLIYGSASKEVPSTMEYVANLRTILELAYARARDHSATAHNRQRQHYNRRVHGAPYARGDLVWLHSPAVPAGVARKLHSPWKGPYLVLDRLLDCTYRIQDTAAGRAPRVVHFNRLKPYTAPNHELGVRPPSPLRPTPPYGDNVELPTSTDDESGPGTENVPDPDGEPPTPSQEPHDVGGGQEELPALARRYPQCTRRPPDQLIDHLSL